MTEKRERCGGKPGEPGYACDGHQTYHTDIHSVCSFSSYGRLGIARWCQGCHSCAPDKWCEHGLEVCLHTPKQRGGHFHSDAIEPKWFDAKDKHHTDGSACVPAKQEAACGAVGVAQLSHIGLKQEPKCPVHGEVLCNEPCDKGEYIHCDHCPWPTTAQVGVYDPAVYCYTSDGKPNAWQRYRHFLCGCPQEQGSGGYTSGLRQASASTERRNPPDPSTSALAMEAANEWFEHQRNPRPGTNIQVLTDIISSAISAAVKECDERIAELERALKPFAEEEAMTTLPTPLDTLIGFYSKAAWLTGWLEQVHPGTNAAKIAAELMGDIGEHLKAETKPR